jgi:hypothetical protein
MIAIRFGGISKLFSLGNHLYSASKSLIKILIPTRFHPTCIHYYYVIRYVIRQYVRSRWFQLCTAWRWRLKSRGRPHGLPTPLVVSLTSYPPRFGTLALTLRSLLRQTVKADRTIVWIAHGDIPLLPKNVTDLLAAGLEIRETDDIKSYKKIIPALQAFPDAFIVTADDDLYYWPRWLEELVIESNGVDRLITCHRAHEVTFDEQGRMRPYRQWIIDTRFRGKSNSIFPTSGGGTLYPPGTLAHSAEDEAFALRLCPDADDIWLYWISRRCGAIYKTVADWREIVAWVGSQSVALDHKNLQGGNDDQIGKMMKRYGLPGR